MKPLTSLSSVLLLATALLAQGPGGPRARGGFGPGFGPEFSGVRSAGPGSHTPVTGAPYSATEVRQFQQAIGGGNQISRQDQSKVYRDMAGRVRIEHTRTVPGQTTAQTIVTIFDPVAGESVMLNPATKTAVKSTIPTLGGAANTRPTRTPPAGSTSPQVTTTDLGTKTINGVPATGTEKTETIPAGAIGNAQPILVVRDTWISTALKVPVQITTTDPRYGNSTMNLTNITQSEPDASLFQIPSDYTVTTRAAGGHGALRRGSPQQ